MYLELERLDKDELLDLIRAYDEYIQNANDENLYSSGWLPVCLNEFYDNEFQMIGE